MAAAVAAVDQRIMTCWQNVYTFVLGAFLVLVISVILHDRRTDKDPRTLKTIRFQQAIGGVGLGAVTVPAWNFRDYDPRLQQFAEDVLYPIPAGYSYSPDRLTMVSSFIESAD
jgi:hypothetical protein